MLSRGSSSSRGSLRTLSTYDISLQEIKRNKKKKYKKKYMAYGIKCR